MSSCGANMKTLSVQEISAGPQPSEEIRVSE